MDSLLIIMAIVALGCVSLLCIFLITTIIRVKDILVQVERDLKEVSAKAIPVLENLEVITGRVKNVTEKIEEQVETVGEAIDSIKGIADDVVDFQQRLQDKIQEPVFEALNVFSSIIRGLRGLVERVRS